MPEQCEECAMASKAVTTEIFSFEEKNPWRFHGGVSAGAWPRKFDPYPPRHTVSSGHAV